MTAYRSPSNGQWYFKCDAPRPAGTKRRQWNRGPFPTKKAAQAAEREAVSAEEVRLALEPGGEVTLTEFLRQWIGRRTAAKPATIQSYTNIVDCHVATHPVGAKRLVAISRTDIDDLLDSIAVKPGRAKGSTLSAKTQANVHRFLKTALATAVERHLIASSPVPARPPAGAAAPPAVKSWSVTEVRAFLAHVDSLPGAEWRAPIYRLALLTGCRRGELLGLRWRHIDFQRRSMRIEVNRVSIKYEVREQEPKTRLSRRTIHLQPQALTVLADLRTLHDAMCASFPGWNPSDYLFTTPEGLPWHPDALRQRFERDVESLPSVARISLHGLRHTYATLAVASGEPAKVVSQRLGHSNVAFTLSQYSHVMPEHDAQSADRVATAMFGDSPHNEAPSTVDGAAVGNDAETVCDMNGDMAR